MAYNQNQRRGNNYQRSNHQGGNKPRPYYNHSNSVLPDTPVLGDVPPVVLGNRALPNTRNQENQSYIHNPTDYPKSNAYPHQHQHQGNESSLRISRPPMEETKAGISIAGNILAKISFCDKQCSNINDNKVKAQIVKHLEAQYGIPIISRDFNVINPSNLRIVSFHQHVLTPLTNGNPYLLLLTRIDGINCCIYIDRKLKDGYTYPKMHCVRYNFQEELFENETVFSGELVKDTERRWVFLLDNILLYKGMTTTEKNVIG